MSGLSISILVLTRAQPDDSNPELCVGHLHNSNGRFFFVCEEQFSKKPFYEMP